MNTAHDIDDDSDLLEPKKKPATSETPFVVLPFIMPMPIFKMLNEEATKLGMSVANLMTVSLQERLKRLQEERERKNGSL